MNLLADLNKPYDTTMPVFILNCFSSSLTGYRSLKKVNEENVPAENDNSSLFPLHLAGIQPEVIPSIRAENGAHDHKQLDSGEVESYSSKDNMNQNESECASFESDQHGVNQFAVLCESEVVKRDTLRSEEVHTQLIEAFTDTTCLPTTALNINAGSN